eukprot:gnl/TRDRNA2_/TRDRNA2_201967_c0_seq1.p1 gnl/TRDRNA2_/TRDRNA2_201967_c0~~gnl/TRDRNA2_/TRDRNA2_201967_c0_seq1.p1  ORF type:complete len:509 (-),score=70.57 gnl/TRDRNA2_/TRDRNA2_201967_c0_seq1:130-1656(-)
MLAFLVLVEHTCAANSWKWSKWLPLLEKDEAPGDTMPAVCSCAVCNGYVPLRRNRECCDLCEAAVFEEPKKIQSARLYGSLYNYGYWFVDLLVGTPPQRVSVIVDTGSSILAFPCTVCEHCGTHIDPPFAIEDSASASWVTCDSTECQPACQEDKHVCYSRRFPDGSAMKGWWFSDEVSFGDAIQQNPRVMATMGCHRHESGNFFINKVNGILGVAPTWWPPNEDGPPALLDSFWLDDSHVDSAVFSLCYADDGGQFVLGGWNESYHTGKIAWTNMLYPDAFSVALLSMTVGDVEIKDFDNAETIVDSGTTYVYMASPLYWQLRAAIEEECAFGGCDGAKRDGNCFNLQAGRRYPVDFPDIVLNFDGASSNWPATSYLFQNGSEPQSPWCYTLMDDGPSATRTFLGAAWMIGKDVIFNQATGMIGMAPAECPRSIRRPPSQYRPHDAPAAESLAQAHAAEPAAPVRSGGLRSLMRYINDLGERNPWRHAADFFKNYPQQDEVTNVIFS